MSWRVVEVMILISLDVELFMRCPVFLEGRATRSCEPQKPTLRICQVPIAKSCAESKQSITSPTERIYVF